MSTCHSLTLAANGISLHEAEDSARGVHAHQWFAVYTTPRHEKRIAEHFTYRNIEHFLPLYNTVSRWRNGTKKDVELPLFPNYIFVHAKRSERVHVLETPGVIDIISGREGPIALPESEIDSLRTAMNLRVLEPHPLLTIGTRVRIRSGALEGFEGVLIRRKNGIRVVCTLDLIAQSIAVEVDEVDVEAVRPLPEGRGPRHFS